MDRFTDRGLKICLLLLAFSAPVSIAATQTAWAFALLFWILRAIWVRPRFSFAAIDLALLTFLGLTLLSSVLSYEPTVSLRKLVAVSLVTIVYLVMSVATDQSYRRAALFTLLAGAFLSVLGTLYFLAVGQNLKVVSMTPDSPLRAAGVKEGDTLWRIDGNGVNSADDLLAVARRHPAGAVVDMTYYRQESVYTARVHVGDKPPENGDLGLGVTDWVRGRDTRASGFYGHYVTYSEGLQLVMSIAFALLMTAAGGWMSRQRLLLAIAFAGYAVAMFLTITRASWAGFLLSAGIMVLVGASRRTVLITVAVAVPLVIAGFFYLQQKRNVTFVDSTDGSTQWRMMVWREGFGVLTSNPRHMVVGVGMDSIKTHWPEWHMFDDGRQPLGHLHSDYLQLAFERGVPALIAWLVWIFLYLKMLWSALRKRELAWPERGLLLGAFGGTIGFLASGVVHYNWGDSEVVMIFYLIMGLSLATIYSVTTAPEQTHA